MSPTLPRRQERIPVSVVVMTKNEERNITRCLTSVANFAEVFVVDSASTDRTEAIAQEFGAHVIQFRWNGAYPKKKQWCLEHLPFSHDWVLYLDADEQVYPETALEIEGVVRSDPREVGFFVGYDYHFMGRTLRHGHRIYKLVLLKHQCGRFVDYDDLDVESMWEVEGHYQPVAQGPTGILRNRMLHKDHDDLFHFFEKLNRYSDWEATLRSRNALRHPTQAVKSRLRKAVQTLGDRTPLRWLAILLYSYIFKAGFLDGRAGLDYAMALSIYHAMTNMKQRSLVIAQRRPDEKSR
jgi:glycosyltransferase involved in cell wall biosynthesis